jgi:hypothetical protein
VGRIVTTAVCGLVLASACAIAQTGADYLDLTRVQVKGDKTKEFEDAIKKMAEMNRKYKGDRWVALSTEYGEFGGYSFSSTRQNMAAVETGIGAFQKALKEGMGPLAEKLMRDLSAYSVSGHAELRHRRWDLSVNTPSTPEELAKMVAKTRWIRALTLEMKPGRNMEYIQAWKPFREELQKVSPAVPILVSEATTGPPAIFVGVYYQSWAEMDAGAPGVQKAVESRAYQGLTKVMQDSVASSRWDILRIRPELSCPPDEVIQADPAFWKPKAAPAAAPKAKMDMPEKK